MLFLHRYLPVFVAAVLFGLGGSALFGQQSSVVSPTASEQPMDPLKRRWKNTLGMRFVAVPGVPILFCVWETRVGDWNGFLNTKKYPWTYQPYFKQDETHPVVGVNLQDAVAFCNWLTEKEREENVLTNAQSYRLPTPEEWDAAAGLSAARKAIGASTQERVEDTVAFVWGLTWPPPAKAANYAENEIEGYTDGYEFTAPVGQFTPTAEGLFDIAGNVWEWTDKPEVKSVPTGILRGGSWAYFRRECLTSGYRYTVPADMRMPTVGFRIVFDDKNYTARLLADSETEKRRTMEDRLNQLRKSNDMESQDIQALKARMMGAGGGEDVIDPSKLRAAEAGASYLNALGLGFVPLEKDGRVLVSTVETRVRDYEAWLKETRGTWVKKPSHLLGDTHPAAGVSWDDAKAFCLWLTKKEQGLSLIPAIANYRLLTDEEWSKAAGLTGETGADPAARHLSNKDHFPWPIKSPAEWAPPTMGVNLDGNKIKGFSDSYPYTSPTDKGLANAIGLRELGGNVSEWCEDVWPGDPNQRVIRGGSYLGYERDGLLTSARQHAVKSSTRNDLGFRLVIDLGAK